MTFGDTVEEATFMAQDALELVILSRLEEKRAFRGIKNQLKLIKNLSLKKSLYP